MTLRRARLLLLILASCSRPQVDDALSCGPGTVRVNAQCVGETASATPTRAPEPPGVDASAPAVAPCRACVLATFPVPLPFRDASGIALGADGRAWFMDRTTPAIGAVTREGAFTSYALPSGRSPSGITRGPDANVWVVTGDATLAKVTVRGEVSEVPGGSDQLGGITAGPDGNLWVSGSRNVHRVSPGGAVSSFPLGEPRAPATSIAAGADGHLWVTRQGGLYSNVTHVSRISTAGAVETFRTLVQERPGIAVRAGIAPSASGDLWFSMVPGLGRVAPNGEVLEARLPAGGLPTALVSSADGRTIYFADYERRVGVIDERGAISQTPILYEPDAIALDADGTVWMTAHEGEASFVLRYRP